MTIVSKRKFGFTSSSVYRRKEPHAFAYLSERATFWIAVLSIFAFVTGNMVGQNGWHVFWKSVLGEGGDSMIVFTGMVPPVPKIPDYDKWAKLGGSPRTNTFRQVPVDLLVAMPTYIRYGDDTKSNPGLRRTYFVEHLGTYETGRGKGSHVGEDISLPEGTPIQSVANGIVDKVGNDPGGYGNYVLIRHPNVPDVEEKGKKSTIYSVYAHLSTVLVQENMVVLKGDQIALSGMTGNASAPHLHFQMDRSDAPFHPYWPFSSADQRSAHMNFVQAIDAGLKRENGVQYTLDPMLTVQAYETYAGPVVADASAASSAQASSSSRARLTMEERRQQRVIKLAAQKTTLVAYNDNTPIVAIPAAASSSAKPGEGTVASVRFLHSGSFQDRGWQTLTITLLDAAGDTIQTPVTGDGKIHLSTAFGRADFDPQDVPFSSFKNGVYRAKILPHEGQTVVVREELTGSMSQPMKYVR